MACNVNSTFSASRGLIDSPASLGKPLSHLLDQARVDLPPNLFNSLTDRFPVFGRPFMRFDHKIQVVDIGYNGHRAYMISFSRPASFAPSSKVGTALTISFIGWGRLASGAMPINS